MLKNYLKSTIRNLVSSKGYSIINLFGLIIGITAFILIMLWVRAETSYDKFHKNAEDIYRVDYILYEEGIFDKHSASGSTGVGKEIKNMFPEVVDYTRFVPVNGLVSYGENAYKETDILYAQSSFFDLFSFPLIVGRADSGLLAVDHAVITEKTAKKYFGDEDPMGKTIKIDGNNEFEITGVVEDVPENSHFKFDILLSYQNLLKDGTYYDSYWVSEQVYTYILVKPGTDIDVLQSKLKEIPEKFFGDFMKSAFFLVEYKLVKLTDIHLRSNISNELEVNGSFRSLVSLGLIAILVLLIAFINYINLATSRAMDRTREVGIRKVSGAKKTDLILQFITESVLLNMIALIISFSGVLLLFPFFKEAMQSPLFINHTQIIILFLVLLVTGSLVTGLVPAIYISGFTASTVLKGKDHSESKWIGRFKNSLVVFQFCISVLLIFGTIIINRQLNFMNRYDIGIDIDQMLVIEGPRVIDVPSYEAYIAISDAFNNDILAQSTVNNLTSSSSVPGDEITNWSVMGVPMEGRNTEKRLASYTINNRFFDTYGLKILAGRNFTPSFQNETRQMIINESALKYYDFKDPEDAIGKKLSGNGQEFTIIGVVNDFNQQSLKELPVPIGFYNQPTNEFYSVKANIAGIGQLIPKLEDIWEKYYPGNPFNYFMMDDYYYEQYNADKRFGSLLLSSSVLAILIACLGLLGLSAYAISRRTKEIGIRKANGAKISQIMILLNKDFVKWVLIAIVIAFPISYYVMSRWLENFAYKTVLSWWIFALAGVMALGIALLTVSWQSWRAATRNPVEALRYE